jgi:DnaJ-class molecular chaperone
MDSNLITSGRKTENLYEIFETLPKDFMNFNQTSLK